MSVYSRGARNLATRWLSSRTLDSSFVKVDGCNVNYVKQGNGQHNVLMLPGALGSWRSDFGGTLAAFDKQNFTLIGWDPPGYGQSSGDRVFDLDMFGRDATVAHNMMKELGLLPYSLVGWSDGANTACHMAHQQRHRKSIRRMVIFGGNAYITQKDVDIYEGIRYVNKWSARMRQPMIDMYGEEKFAQMWNSWTDLFCKGFFIDNQENLFRELLADIAVPTLIIHGEKDPVVPSEHAYYLHKHIRDSILIFMPAGHNLHLKLADDFSKVVADFLLDKNHSKL